MKKKFIMIFLALFFALSFCEVAFADLIADAGGPYDIMWGSDLFLDGSGSYTTGRSAPIASYNWIIASEIGDILTSGETATVAWSDTYWLPNNPYVVQLIVSDADSIVTGSAFIEMNVSPVPEPATMLLFGTGLVCLAGSRMRRKITA